MLDVLISKQAAEASALAMAVVGLATFVGCLIVTAPYGRFSTPQGWGVLIPAKLAWILMETPNLWVTALVVLYSQSYSHLEGLSNTTNRALLGMFVLHYIHRSLIFPQFLQSTKPMPFNVMLLAFLFCTWNGYNQSVTLVSATYTRDYMSESINFPVGVAIFFIGFFVNLSADYRLLYLKRTAAKAGKGVEYVIPTEGLFDYISCPNYFGEIVEWLGFAIACNTPAAWAFVWYTTSNLLPRALAGSMESENGKLRVSVSTSRSSSLDRVLIPLSATQIAAVKQQRKQAKALSQSYKSVYVNDVMYREVSSGDGVYLERPDDLPAKILLALTALITVVVLMLIWQIKPMY
eukprot:gene24479-29588_t